MNRIFGLTVLAIIIACLLPAETAAQPGTVYTVEFTSTWSSSTHPQGFPSNPHFSGLIGATHNADLSLWSVGAIATAGMEQMAETGGKSGLRTEIQTARQTGSAGFVLDGGGIGTSPGTVTLEFSINENYPFVSLVSMIAPSPDWFVGVDNLLLFENGSWKDRVEVQLFAYDAGTDDGSNYTSSNADTQPKESISRLSESPFVIGGSVPPIGTFVFQCQMQCSDTNTNVHEEATLPSFRLEPPFPNPTTGQTNVLVSRSGGQPITISVFDSLGRLQFRILEGPSTGASTPVSLSHLPSGVYLIQAVSIEGRQSHKIVVAR